MSITHLEDRQVAKFLSTISKKCNWNSFLDLNALGMTGDIEKITFSQSSYTKFYKNDAVIALAKSICKSEEIILNVEKRLEQFIAEEILYRSHIAEEMLEVALSEMDETESEDELEIRLLKIHESTQIAISKIDKLVSAITEHNRLMGHLQKLLHVGLLKNTETPEDKKKETCDA